MANSSYEIPSDMREIAEKSVDQARRAFENFVSAAQRAAGQADTTTASVQNNARTLGTTAMGFVEQNVRTAFDLAQKLVRARDFQEVLEIQSDYAKSQISTIQDQAKELGSIMQTAAQGAVSTAAAAARNASEGGTSNVD